MAGRGRPRGKRYRTDQYVEDPNLGLSIDTSTIDAEILDDPVKLLQWLADGEDGAKELPHFSSATASIVGERVASTTGTAPNVKLPDSAKGKKTGKTKKTRATKQRSKTPARRESGISDREFKKLSSILEDAKPLSEYSGKLWEIEYLNDNGIKCVDFRSHGGALWIVGDYTIAAEIGFLRSCGLDLKYKPEGSTATNGEPGWWTADESPQKPYDLERKSQNSQVINDAESSSDPFEDASSDSPESFDAEDVFSGDAPLAVPELIGILIGITFDDRVNELETKSLLNWLKQIDDGGDERLAAVKRLLEQYLEDGVIDEGEEQNLLTLFKHIINLANGISTATDKQITDSSEEEAPAKKLPWDAVYIRSKGYRCVDLRDEGGALWIIGGSVVEPLIRDLKARGMSFMYSPSGSLATKHAPGWWTKDVVSEEPAASSVQDDEKPADTGIKPPVPSIKPPASAAKPRSAAPQPPKPPKPPIVSAPAPIVQESSESSNGREADAAELPTQSDHIITVTQVNGQVRSLSVSNIVYIKANGVTSFIQTRDDVLEAKIGLYQLQTKLKDYGFIRPHRSYVVNKSLIDKIVEQEDGTYILRLIDDGFEIPAHKSSRALLNSVFDFDSEIYVGFQAEKQSPEVQDDDVGEESHDATGIVDSDSAATEVGSGRTDYPRDDYKIYIPDDTPDDIDIDCLFLPIRTIRMLKEQGIEYITDFDGLTFGQVCKFPHSGPIIAKEIFNCVEQVLEDQ